MHAKVLAHEFFAVVLVESLHIWKRRRGGRGVREEHQRRETGTRRDINPWSASEGVKF